MHAVGGDVIKLGNEIGLLLDCDDAVEQLL